MAVQFILGPSGTGKTSYCIKAIVNALRQPDNNQPLILLVPEQATYQAERAILSDERIAGYSSGSFGYGVSGENWAGARLNVLSFDRLQFLLLGRNTARPQLSRIGRQMVVHRILRENSSKLKVFGSKATQPGLGQQIAEVIAELHHYAKTPEDIDQLLSKLQQDQHNNLTALKFADISLIFKEYLKFIEGSPQGGLGRFIDPDIQLNRALTAVAGADFIKGAKLWVDGFASFTTAEIAILAEMLKVVSDAQIALCLDPSSIHASPDSSIFIPTEQTYADLIEIIKKSKLKLEKPIILDEAVRFSSCRQLAHIQQNIFKLQPPKISVADNIHIISAPNSRAEVQFVARQILHLVKQKDYRYRDIAVIASDIDHYEHYIRAYFDDYNIPFFIDKPKPASQHPLAGLICSALQAVIGGFSSNDVFAYLKTDLVPIERFDIDLLENYCLAFGISGSDWQSNREWNYAGKDNEDFDEQRINQIRARAIGPLMKLRDQLCPSDNPEKKVSAEKFTQIIFDFLDSIQVRQRISQWIARPLARNFEFRISNFEFSTVLARQDEHRQFYDNLVNIFDELVEVFADQQMSCEDYLVILASAFSQLTLSFIPPTLDQVLVGSIERSRHPSLKAAFLIGATAKQFPTPVSFDSILTDEDRIAASKAGFSLAATQVEKLTHRQYLAYIAFTRASEFLCITYPSVDDKASPIPRSQFITELESLFENLNEESIASEQIDIENIGSEDELADLLCSQLGRDVSREAGSVKREVRYDSRDTLHELLEDICQDEQLCQLGDKVLSALNYDNAAQLDKQIVDELFGQQIRSSATRLGIFASCPYRYFAQYILELKERPQFKFEPLDLGDFYHRILSSLLKQLNKEGKDFATIGDQELLKILADRIAEFVQTNSFISNFIRKSRHNAFIIDSAGEVLEDCVLAIAEMVRAGKFMPMLSEVAFGQVEDAIETIGEYKIGLSDGRILFLDGKIDRLDIANINGEKIAIVFDYKKSADKSFDWSKFYHGLDMQLPIYMLAVRNATQSKVKTVGTPPCGNPVGAFYLPIEVSPKTATLGELGQQRDNLNYKARGIFNGDFAHCLDEKALKNSEFYNFYVTKDGKPYGNYRNRAALTPDDFEKVLSFAEAKVIQLAEEILSGKIEVKPYRLGDESPCGYCKYKSVCRFDWQINDYNPLVSLNKLQVLKKIKNKK